MSLSYTILGFLNLGEMTGYELKKAIDNSTQFFWHAELSQIYPTLKSLEEKGKVVAQVFPQNGKPDKKVYSITSAGHSALIDWLREPMDETPPVKSPVLLKLFFMGVLNQNELLAQMRCQVEMQHARLVRYQQESKRYIQQAVEAEEPDQSQMMWELIREYGEMQTKTSILWMETAIQKIAGMNENSGH